MWCKGYRMVVLGKVLGATLVHWCYNGSFKIYWYFACFQSSFIQQLERVGGALPALFQKNYWKFIKSSRRILGDSFYCIYDYFSCNIDVWQCICLWVSKEVLWILIVIVGSGVLKTLLYCSFSSSLSFWLLGFRFPSSSWRGPIPALTLSCF